MTEFGRWRPLDDPPDRENDGRRDGERDSDRVLYSSSFRRLSGVTQVISPQDDYIYHDRSMHSLKVAQVAQRTAQKMNRVRRRNSAYPEIDPDVVHAAALAHDLGHPPFGHAAEEELQLVLGGKVDRGGQTIPDGTPILRDLFEGNAQTFRIVGRLAARKEGERVVVRRPGQPDEEVKVGLNLLWRTYAAILKYPWTRERLPPGVSVPNKWGVYDSELEFLVKAREYTQQASPVGERPIWDARASRSLEAQIMDWSDDVAYAVHDTEDFFRAKLIPLDRLSLSRDIADTKGSGNRKVWTAAAFAKAEAQKREVLDMMEWPHLVHALKPKVAAALDRLGLSCDDGMYYLAAADICDNFPARSYHGDTETREQLHTFASKTIGRLTSGLTVRAGELKVPTYSIMQAEFLKKLTRYFVIDQADLLFDQHGQREIVRHLFFDLFALTRQSMLDGDDDAKRTLPSRLREYARDDLTASHMSVYGTEEAKIARAVTDFICSLTDRQAGILARRLAGDLAPTPTSWVSI